MAKQALLFHNNSLEMYKVILAASGNQAPPFLRQCRVVPKLPDIAFFKGIGLVGRVHGIDSDPSVNVAGEPLFESLHDPRVYKGTGHDLVDEDVSGQVMENLGAKLITDIFHCSVYMAQHNISFFVGLPDKHFF